MGVEKRDSRRVSKAESVSEKFPTNTGKRESIVENPRLLKELAPVSQDDRVENSDCIMFTKGDSEGWKKLVGGKRLGRYCIPRKGGNARVIDSETTRGKREKRREETETETERAKRESEREQKRK